MFLGGGLRGGIVGEFECGQFGETVVKMRFVDVGSHNVKGNRRSGVGHMAFGVLQGGAQCVAASA